MTYKELADHLLSLPTEIQNQKAYFKTDWDIVSIDKNMKDVIMGEKSHSAFNTSTQQWVNIVDKEGTVVKVLSSDYGY